MQRTDSFEKTLMWERLKAGERNDRGWGGWMVSPTQWAWVWARFRSWWWTGKPSVLQAVGWSWTEQMNWTELRPIIWLLFPHLTHSRTLPWGAHAHLSRGGSQSEGFWEKQDSLWPRVIPWLLTHREPFYACVISPLSPKNWEQRCLNSLLNQSFARLCSSHDCYLDYCHDCYLDYCHDCYLDYCHDYCLKVFTRDKHWLLPCFCC